jgi:hypothetical protein
LSFFENLRGVIKKKQEEEEEVVRVLSSANTNLPSSKNNIPVNTSFFSSLFQDVNEEVKRAED